MATSFTVTVNGKPVHVPFNDGIHAIDITSSNNGPAIIKVIKDKHTASTPITVDQTHDEVLKRMAEARRRLS